MTLLPALPRAQSDSSPDGPTVSVLRLRPRRAWLPRMADAGLSGCGWYESSRELAEGLEVTECTWDGFPTRVLND